MTIILVSIVLHSSWQPLAGPKRDVWHQGCHQTCLPAARHYLALHCALFSFCKSCPGVLPRSLVWGYAKGRAHRRDVVVTIKLRCKSVVYITACDV